MPGKESIHVSRESQPPPQYPRLRKASASLCGGNRSKDQLMALGDHNAIRTAAIFQKAEL
jgi:hypothetical protein